MSDPVPAMLFTHDDGSTFLVPIEVISAYRVDLDDHGDEVEGFAASPTVLSVKTGGGQNSQVRLVGSAPLGDTFMPPSPGSKSWWYMGGAE